MALLEANKLNKLAAQAVARAIKEEEARRDMEAKMEARRDAEETAAAATTAAETVAPSAMDEAATEAGSNKGDHCFLSTISSWLEKVYFLNIRICDICMREETLIFQRDPANDDKG